MILGRFKGVYFTNRTQNNEQHPAEAHHDHPPPETFHDIRNLNTGTATVNPVFEWDQAVDRYKAHSSQANTANPTSSIEDSRPGPSGVKKPEDSRPGPSGVKKPDYGDTPGPSSSNPKFEEYISSESSANCLRGGGPSISHPKPPPL
eukprot:6657024-Pyramimonas_sp.AAC.1